eukprot:g12829.t1
MGETARKDPYVKKNLLPGDGAQAAKAPWVLELEKQHEALDSQQVDLQSCRKLVDHCSKELQELNFSYLQRQGQVESLLAKQGSSLQSLRQKVSKDRFCVRWREAEPVGTLVELVLLEPLRQVMKKGWP